MEERQVPDAEQIEPEDLLDLDELEELLRRKKPSTFATETLTQPIVWQFPHDPEQWIEVKKLTAAEVRQYQAIQAQLYAKLQRGRLDETEIRFRAPEAYLYLLKHSIVRFRFKRGNDFIEGEVAKMRPDQLDKLFSELTPEVAAWIERKLLIFNELTPAAQRKKPSA